MTRNNKRKAFFVTFMLPFLLLGVSALVVGFARTWAELGGVETPADTVSGIGMIGMSLIPLGAAAVVLYFVLRSSHALPPPSADQLAPGAPTRRGRFDFDRPLLEQTLQALGMTLESPSPETILSVSSRDSWSFGVLLFAAAAGLGLFAGWPSWQAGHLAFAPAPTALAVFYGWISLFCVLLAMPISPRRVLLEPAGDAVHLEIGRKRRTFGLSRLAGLEARIQVMTARDSDTSAVRSRSFYSQLVAWFRAGERGLVPFVLLWGPSATTHDESDEHHALMEAAAAELARGLGVHCGRPEQPDGTGPVPDTEPYE